MSVEITIETNMAWRSKEKSVQDDQTSLYSQFEDLVLQALYSCIVRDAVKEYRYQRAEALQKYNAIATFSHVALENYALLQLWKLFDRQSSTMHVWYVAKHMPHPELTTWFDARVNDLKSDIKYLSAWRHNFVGHRSAVGHFAPNEFDHIFKNERGNEERVRQFLLDFLCEMKFHMYRTSREEQSLIFKEILIGYRRFAEGDRDEVMQKYN